MKPFLVFDLDGTLVDTARDLVGTLNALLREHDLPIVALHDARSLIGRGAPALLERGFGERLQACTANERQTLLKRFVAHYEAHLLDHATLYDGVADVLGALRADGYEMAVCTSKGTGPATTILEGLGIARLFSAVCGGDFFPGAKKPDPAHVLGTIARAGRTPDQGAIFIGDSSVDVKSARNARLPIVYATYGYSDIDPATVEPDAEIATFAALPDAVATIAAQV